MIEASGWPCLALRAAKVTTEAEHKNAQHPLSDAAWEARRNRDGWMIPTHDWQIPYRPIWPGFAINTLVFAAPVFALILLAPIPFGRARSRWRTWKGRCPRCAYSRAGLPSGHPCPECGTSSR